MKTILTAMKISISEVMETMFFLPVEYSERLAAKEVKMLKGKQNKACCLDFCGDFSGTVYLLVPSRFLREMAENFMGEPGDLFGDEILEGTLTETVNMMSGNALRKLNAGSPFQLTVPRLIPGSEFPEGEGSIIVKTTGPEMAVHITLQ